MTMQRIGKASLYVPLELLIQQQMLNVTLVMIQYNFLFAKINEKDRIAF
jgi:hypothetical protein